MYRIARPLWIATCASLGWYFAGTDAQAAWWGVVIGAGFGALFSPQGLSRMLAMFAGGLLATGFAFHLLGVSSDYTIFWFVGGAWLGAVMPIAFFVGVGEALASVVHWARK